MFVFSFIHITHKYQVPSGYTCRFLLRKISSTWSGWSALLWAVTMSPAVEKILSAGTLVPGIHRYRFAWHDNRGYSPSCSLHHWSGLVESGSGFTCLYLMTSFRALSLVLLDTTTGVYVFPRRSAKAQESLAFFDGGPQSSAGSSSCSSTSSAALSAAFIGPPCCKRK